MVYSVQQRIHAISRRVRRLTALHAVCTTLTLGLVAGTLICLLDSLIRYEDPGLRLLGSALWLGVIVWSTYRFVWPVGRSRPSDLLMAQWLEQTHPEWSNRFSSGLAFAMQEDDPYAGSPELRRAVVADAQAALSAIDPDRCLDVRRPRRMGVVAAVTGLLVMLLFVAAPRPSLLAARRLALPWASAPWPRRHELAFLDPPRRLAVGDEFEVALIDRRNSLPEDVTIFYWFEGDSESHIQDKAMRFLNDRVVHRLENVTRSFRYRAVGGDDDTMPWQSLEVVDPPRVTQLSFRLHPPDYTGWPAVSSGENILALEGTVVAVQGELDKPAAAVDLHMETEDGSQRFPAAMRSDGRAFSLAADASPPWVLEESGRYWFTVTDREGLAGGQDRRWNVRVLADTPPEVRLDKPGANTFVTAAAAVPIHAVVKDDLAIRRIELRFRRSDQPEAGDTSRELYRGPERPVSPTDGPDLTGKPGETREVASPWELSRLEGLEPGNWIELRLVAEDYKPQQGQSSARRLTIISREELDERLAARQSYLLSQLNTILAMQQDTRLQVSELEQRGSEHESLDRAARDQLQSAELNQRQIGHRLADPADGVAAQITTVLDELASNRVDNPEAERRMRELLAVIDSLGRQQLPEIQRQLIGALKLAREQRPETSETGNGSRAELLRTLGSARQQQDEVIAALEERLGSLSQWDDYRRFARELSRLQRDQASVLEHTETLRSETLGQRPEDLSTAQQATAKRLGERQTELAHQLDRLLGRMTQMQQQLDESQPLAAATLADALEQAQQAGVAARMRDSRRQIEANQVTQAVETQQQIQQTLNELIDMLAGRREQELDRSLRGLEQAADQLAELRRQVAQLQPPDRPDDSPGDPSPEDVAGQEWRAEAGELAESAGRLARRLQRLQAPRSGRMVDQAAMSLHQATEPDPRDRAVQMVAQAEQQLEQAQQRLEAEQQQARQSLARERMARLQQQIGELLQRQQEVLQATAAIESPRDASGSVDEAPLSSREEVAAEQQQLAEDTRSTAREYEGWPVLVLGLRGASRYMEAAENRLNQGLADDVTQNQQIQAITRLSQIAQSLQEDPAAEFDPERMQPEDEPLAEEETGEDAGDLLQVLAELKLLISMQQQIQQRTEVLSDRLDVAPDQEPLERELEELVREQGELADLLFQLAGQLEESP